MTLDEPHEEIHIGPDGTVRSAGPVPRLGRRAGRYLVAVDAPGMVLLRAQGRQGGTRVLMAGEIVTAMTVMEIINVIATSGWRGELIVAAPDSRRVLTFDQGALKGGHSNVPGDRLGEILYHRGVLERRQLNEIVEAAGPERRFGQLVVEQGFVGQEELFKYLQLQAEQIFNGALLVRDGSYLFRLPGDDEAPVATLHIPVQALLMEGVQRIDEMALFRERIPSLDLCPEVKSGAPDRKLDPQLMTILAYCDGDRSIRDIARESGLDHFEITKSIYHLLQQGLVQLRAGHRIDEQAVRRLISSFNDVMRDIFFAVATYGGIDQTRRTLGTWIQGSGYGPYFGDNVEEDGSINVDAVLSSLSDSAHDSPLEGLHQALHELAAFALFAATTTLPRDQELSLSRDVNQRLKSIRI